MNRNSSGSYRCINRPERAPAGADRWDRPILKVTGRKLGLNSSQTPKAANGRGVSSHRRFT